MFIQPVAGNITSPFGYRTNPVTGAANTFHNGIDIGAAEGTPIKAAANGYVTSVIPNGGHSGNYVILTHPNAFVTGYLHMSKFNVRQGDTVRQGDVIGYVGHTGAVTGAHLHFLIKNANGEYVNPVDYMGESTGNFFATDYGKSIRATELFAWGGLALLAVGIYRSSHE